MATIDSTSTDADITAAYMGNCGYREDDSATMAAAFVTACMAMMARGITRFQHGEEALHFSPEDLRELVKDAQSFIRSKGGVTAGGSGVVRVSLQRFRD